MKKKVVALIRTSTDAQEVESQKEEVVSLILSDGYRKEEIEVVGDSGASAIKLDKLYIQNLHTVYDLIETGEIEAVYAWAIDRIGRNEEVLMEFKNRLIRKKVQLVIKNPSLRLLNADGSVNSGIELAFSLFTTMAKQEMEQKKERFERAKKRNWSNGKWVGGSYSLGYKIDRNNFIVVDEEEAALVRYIYDLFNTGKYSTVSLAKELNDRGCKTKKGYEFTPVMVCNILKHKSYIGGYTDKNGNRHNYPAIISEETQEKAKKILATNNTRQLKSTKHYFFANKLITCKECGRYYQILNGTYHCTGNILSKREGSKHLSSCSNTTSLSCNNIDGILWTLTKEFLIREIESDNSAMVLEIKEQINVLQQKINVLENRLSLYDKKIEDIVENADIELRSEQYISKRIANVNQQREKENKELVKMYEERNRLNDNLIFSSSFQKWFTGYNSISEVELKGDEKYMRELVHRYISNVVFEKTTYEGNSNYYKIDISTNKGVYTVFYNGRSRYLDHCFYKAANVDYIESFSFERMKRTENGVTTESNERFRKFHDLIESLLPTIKDAEELWNRLNDNFNTELSELFKTVQADNPQRVVQYINEVSIRLQKDKRG